MTLASSARRCVGGGEDDLYSMVRQIRDSVCGEVAGTGNGEANAAIEALVQMGLSKSDASRRVGLIVGKRPEIQADVIIKEALKE